jgi:choline monooxygenase
VSLLETLPVQYYLDPAVWQIERQRVFAASWVMIANEHQLVRSGDYVAEQVAGWPVFVQRTESGSLRAFHNLCPHRAGPIVWDGVGNQANLVCRYHGWAFDGDGKLLNARDFGAAAPEGTCLTKIRAQSWRGMVFVCLDPTTPDLVEWLGGFVEACAAYPSNNYRFHSRSIRRTAMNWKVYNDNFLEGYHLPLVHPAMCKEVDALKYTVISHGDPRWNLHLAPQRDGHTWTGVWGYFYPCFSFDIFPGGMAVERWLPVGNTHTDLIFEYFFDDDATDIEKIVKDSEEVADEDVRVAESVQRNLSAGLYTTGCLSPRHEHAVGTFHTMVREAVDPMLATPVTPVAVSAR